MSLSFSWPALTIAALISIALYLLKKPEPASFPYPHLTDLATHPSLKAQLASLPRILALTALGLFLLAFSNPYLKEAKMNPAPRFTEGVAIYLIIDHSGSMLENTASGESKLDFAKKMTAQFINERQSDMIGLVSFARSAQALVPLTLDHADLLKNLDAIAKVPDISQEGTAIGYAIYKTVNLLTATRHFAKEKGGYDMKNSIIVLLTDGLQDPNPLDTGNKLRTMGLDEAAQFAKENGVKLYLINVEPQIASEQFAPHRRQFQRITEFTGGKFYLADNPSTLSEVYAAINRLEKSPLPSDAYLIAKRYFYPYLLALGALLLFLSLLLDTTVLRRAP